MSENPPSDYAGITDESRVHKPPGGDTNDIFGLERRQKWQASQLYPNNQDIMSQDSDQRYNMKPVDHTDVHDGQESDHIDNQKISKDDERKFANVSQHFAQEGEHRLRNIEHDIPLASCLDYAGVTDKTRVRKPPGGDTNDIFDMESRQRSQAETKQININRFIGTSNIPNQKDATRFSDTALSTNKLKTDQFTEESPLFQMDKENLLLNGSADILKKKHDEDESKQPSKMYVVRNPITGEVSEMKGSTCSKMSDRSNVVSNLGVKNPELNRPCVRVRQPPGGVSSNIF